MKIKVVGHEGAHEALTLTEPLVFFRGEKINRIRTITGIDHFFLEDGTYDGWGMAIPASTEDEAIAIIKQTEKDREVGGDLER